MNDSCACLARLSTARFPWGVGVEPGVWGVGGGLAHCWALRDQAGCFSCSVQLGGGGGWVGLLGVSHGRTAREVWGWWWVGLLFEICIVDASIFVALVVVLCL